MGFFEILTLIFVVLKLCGVIGWSWWLVLLPEIIAVGIYILVLCIYFHTVRKTERDFWDNFRR